MMRFFRLFFLLIVVFLAGLPGRGQEKGVLKIAVTTDVHGAYFPVDWFTGKSLAGSLAQVQSWAREQTSVMGHEVILLDNGDLIQGDPASYFSNFVDTMQQNLAARILNYMKYEGATVGNHDIEAGHRVYDRLSREFNFPLMAANAIRTVDRLPYFKPYTMIRRSGLDIAVIGLVTPKIPDWLPPVLWTGMEFCDMIESARHWVELVKKSENPDLVIGLFHAGVDPSYGQQSPGKPMNENASRLVAEQVAGFHVIFTGHDHRHWNFKVADPNGDSVLILGSESRAEEIAVASLHPFISGEHVRMADYAPDQEFMDLFKGDIEKVQNYVDQPVGMISESVGTEDSYFGPSGFTDLIHRAQMDLSGADISFTAPLSFRAVLPAGKLRIKDLFRLYRFENQLYIIRLTGKEILGYLNFSYSLWMKQMAGPDDPMLNISEQPDGSWRFRNASYNFDSAMGIEYVVDLSKPAGSLVSIRRFSDGRPFDTDKMYLVALNSYRASGGGDHLFRGAGLSREECEKRVVRSSEEDFRFLLSQWIQRKGTVDPVPGVNWKVIPDEWIQQAAPRDKARLFGQGDGQN